MNSLTVRYAPGQANAVAAGSPPPTPPEELCGSPCLIVHGWGPASEQVAQQVADQCRELHIRCRVRAVDDRDGAELARFPSLVAVLPTFSDNMKVRTALEPFANLIADYRLRWPDGLASVLESNDPLDAGVVHLIGERVLVHNPAMRSSLRRACHVHISDQDGTFDMLRPYRRPCTPAAPWEELGDVATDTLHQTWSHIKEWGVTDPRTVAELLLCIQRCRSYYEDPNKPQLYRPHPELERNRLDLILDGPEIQIGNRKTWSENGARVWRYVLQQLQLVEPAIRRPANVNARGAQKDLRRLYIALKIVNTYLRASRTATLPTFQ